MSRNLTDDDVDAIVNGLREQIKKEFYEDLGRGVWGYCKRGLLLLVAVLVAYGAGLHK